MNDPAQDLDKVLERAMDHHRAGRYAEAASDYERVLEQNPDQTDALNLLGVLAYETNNIDTAIALTLRAVTLRPDRARYLTNHANALAAAGRHDDAEKMYMRAIALDQGVPAAPYNLALMLFERRRLDEAQKWLLEVVRLAPDNVGARYLADALANEGSWRTAPAAYIEEVFDHYAYTFDHHLSALEYRVPEKLREMLDKTVDVPGEPLWTVVDIGCGTGRCGPLFRNVAKRLIGCDLSTRMLVRAHTRNVYDDLRAEELITTLNALGGEVDLVIGADVLVYIGDLRSTFTAVAGALRPGGWFVFSIEEAVGGSFSLEISGRFAHSQTYIEREVNRAGLEIEGHEPTQLRKEANNPVEGRVYVVRRPP